MVGVHVGCYSWSIDTDADHARLALERVEDVDTYRCSRSRLPGRKRRIVANYWSGGHETTGDGCRCRLLSVPVKVKP